MKASTFRKQNQKKEGERESLRLRKRWQLLEEGITKKNWNSLFSVFSRWSIGQFEESRRRRTSRKRRVWKEKSRKKYFSESIVDIMALLSLPKRRTRRTKGEFLQCTFRIVNTTNCYINFKTSKGLRSRVLSLMWKFVKEKYSLDNLCCWQLCCDCQDCKDKWTIF